MKTRNRFPLAVLVIVFAAAWCEIGTLALAQETRSITITGDYLQVPVGADTKRAKVFLKRGDTVLHYFDVEIAPADSEPRFWANLNVSGHKGENLTLTRSEGEGEGLLARIRQSDTPWVAEDAYREALRPQYHFAPRTGWTNDPNGLVFMDGEYHLFFQHNPFGTRWGNMTWGHAVSPDLMHWTELGDALHPDALGTIFSGSAVVDHENTSGLQTGDTPPLVAFYTSAGKNSYASRAFTQSMAYSLDRGRTWIKYPGNPVVEHITGSNRDPKVFWHAASKKWIMVLYLDRGLFTLLGSPNLRTWERLSDIDFPDGHECPELFELPVDGDATNTRWVMWEGAGRHMLGRFDGERFTAESGVMRSEWGDNCYAAQTYNDVPDGRRILIGWMRAGKAPVTGEPTYPGMPFNQQMSIPRELSLRTTPAGIRLFAKPAREIRKVHEGQSGNRDFVLNEGDDQLCYFGSREADYTVALEAKDAAVTVQIGDVEVNYDAKAATLTCLGKTLQFDEPSEELQLRALADRASLELFLQDGRYVMSFYHAFPKKDFSITLHGDRGQAHVRAVIVHACWPIAAMNAKAR